MCPVSVPDVFHKRIYLCIIPVTTVESALYVQRVMRVLRIGVTVANPTSDKQKLHKADISMPCLVTFKESKVQTRRQHAKRTRTECPGH